MAAIQNRDAEQARLLMQRHFENGLAAADMSPTP